VSCRLGALFAGADETTVEQMDGFGRDLGIAFQIADDLLDVLGDEKTTGKSLGTDLAKEKATLPVIRALELASETDRQAILDLVSSDDRRPQLLVPILERYGAIAYTRKRAATFSQRARRRLDNLASTSCRDVLAAMTEFVVSRSM